VAQDVQKILQALESYSGASSGTSSSNSSIMVAA